MKKIIAVVAVAMLATLADCHAIEAAWPPLKQCVDAPSHAEIDAVIAVLASGKDVNAGLENLALNYARDSIECAVQLAVDMLSKRRADGDSKAIERGQAFLASVRK